jgi:hypothetical protein
VNSERRRVATLLAVTTLGLILALGVQPVSVERILAAYLLALAGIGLASLTRILASESTHGYASRFEHALTRKPEQPGRPAELVRIEREITLGTSTAGHFHNRLAPLLRDAAAARFGFALEQRPDAARARLGSDTWELVRPDRPAPEDRSGPGVPLARVRSAIDTLERL